MPTFVARPALPPGPRAPLPVQTVAFAAARQHLIPRWHRRHGDMFTLRLPHGNVVLLADPEHIRTVWNGSSEVFHAGEGNAILRPVMGDESVLLLDEDAHRRARRLLLPAFAGAALRGYRELFTTIAAEQARGWEPGPAVLAPRLQRITLEVILRVVFGITDDAVLGELRGRLPRLVATSPMVFLGAFWPAVQGLPPWRGYRENLLRIDGLLHRQIADRRRGPSGGTDVLSRLLAAQDGAEHPLSDTELRDQLVTLLLAGHETTATALAWTLHELLRAPAELRRAVAAADGADPADDAYLEAAVKEALRLRPVIPQVARRLTEPVRIGGHLLPAGTVVAPSILLAHHDERRYERALAYRPRRFLDGEATSVDWLPFGGGVRRCLGANFALLEAAAILRVLLREFGFAAPGRRAERVRARNITLVPGDGVRAVLTRRAGR